MDEEIGNVEPVTWQYQVARVGEFSAFELISPVCQRSVAETAVKRMTEDGKSVKLIRRIVSKWEDA